MEIINNNRYRNLLKLLLVFVLITSVLGTESLAVSNNVKDKKAIIFILDEMSLEDILNSKTPNMDKLIDNGGLGFMNTRGKQSISNRGTRYLSLGMGVRTLSSSSGGWAFAREEDDTLLDYKLVEDKTSAGDMYRLNMGKDAPEGEIINVALGDIYRNAFKATPNNEVGLLGRIARENGIKIGLVGNSDTRKLSREASLLAMDEHGVIPYGYVESDLLSYDKEVLGGKKINRDRMLEEIDRVIEDTDILFVDYGDTVRAENTNGLALDHIKEEEKQEAIERGDSFLGELMNKVDLDSTLFMVISPNPSQDMFREKNFGVTPVIMSGGGLEKGLLTSSTTRREGLVTNFDFGPTVLNYFEEGIAEGFVGESMSVISNDKPRETLSKNYSEFLYLRNFRKVFHWGFIILVLLTLLGAYLPQFIKWKGLPENLLRYMATTVTAIPLTMMMVSVFGYKNIILDILFVFLGAFLLGFILDKIFKDIFKTIMTLALLTSGLLIVDTFFIKNLMIISPLGSDAIAGGRFYGIGNDYMGILLGSSLLGIFILYEELKLSKNTMAILLSGILGIIIIGLSPFVGANMGGTLSAMIIFLMALLIVLEKKISFKKVSLIVVGVGIVILGVALLDTVFNPNPTHAGKAIQALLTGGGFGKLIEIISIKLRQVFWNLAYASWNIVLFLQIILFGLLYKFKKKDLLAIKENNQNLFKGLTLILLASIAIFLFNDTGTIAAAMILTYLTIPMGLILNKVE